MVDHPDDSIELEAHVHPDNDHSSLSDNIGPKKFSNNTILEKLINNQQLKTDLPCKKKQNPQTVQPDLLCKNNKTPRGDKINKNKKE